MSGTGCVFFPDVSNCGVVVVVVVVPLKGGHNYTTIVNKWKSTTFTQLHNWNKYEE